jgi:putative addiction module killer protein
MIEVRQTEEFSGWLHRLKCAPGYRIYYVHRGAEIVILLCGGDKRTQHQDIQPAQKLAETL